MAKKKKSSLNIKNPTSGLSQEEIQFAELIVLKNMPAIEALEKIGIFMSNKQSAIHKTNQLKQKTRTYIEFLRGYKAEVKDELNISDLIEDLISVAKFDIMEVIEYDALGRARIKEGTFMTRGISEIAYDGERQQLKVKGYDKLKAIDKLASIINDAENRKLALEERKLELLEKGLEIKMAVAKGEMNEDSVDPNLLNAITNLARVMSDDDSDE